MTAMLLHIDPATVEAVAREVACPECEDPHDPGFFQQDGVWGYMTYRGDGPFFFQPCEPCHGTGRVPDPSALRVLTVADVPKVPCPGCKGRRTYLGEQCGCGPGVRHFVDCGRPPRPCSNCEDGMVPWPGGPLHIVGEQRCWDWKPSCAEDPCPAGIQWLCPSRQAAVLRCTAKVLRLEEDNIRPSPELAATGQDFTPGRFTLVIVAVERLAEPVVEMVCDGCPGDGSQWVTWHPCPCNGSGRVPLDLPLGVLTPVVLAEEARHG